MNYPHQHQIDLSDSDVETALNVIRGVTIAATRTLGAYGGLWMWQADGTTITLGLDSEDDLGKFAQALSDDLGLAKACPESDYAL
ncbi:hypothetical protein [Microvirga sp. VF16]|uniref:hypothetical protein n=1 Tax=Microvirga sp. VF16 TaxID=2807101 RepID=UPI00193CE05F|nr:hypothetical protein [Microvirga sp. VF16]QRM28352.1 hypothetical protein JO965_19235 [Microvirga sp. VF16]